MILTALLGPPFHHSSKIAIRVRDQRETAELTNGIETDQGNAGARATVKPAPRPSTSRRLRVMLHRESWERKAAAASDGGGGDGGLRRERGDEERANGPGEVIECGPVGLAAEGRGSRGHLPPPCCLGSDVDSRAVVPQVQM